MPKKWEERYKIATIKCKRKKKNPFCLETKYVIRRNEVSMLRKLRDEQRLQRIYYPIHSRLCKELRFLHYKYTVPVSYVQAVDRYESEEKPVTFRASLFTWQNICHRLMMLQSLQLSLRKEVHSFQLRSPPQDQVYFIDSFHMCSLNREEKLHFYVPVYFRCLQGGVTIIYCFILSWFDMLEWGNLRSQWVPEQQNVLEFNLLIATFRYLCATNEHGNLKVSLVSKELQINIDKEYFAVPSMSSFFWLHSLTLTDA